MSRQQALESVSSPAEQAHGHGDATDRRFQFIGPWFSSHEAQAYVCCKTIKGWYEWRRRHGIIARANGSVAKADLDRVLRRRPATRRMNPASLLNLRLRRSA